MKEEVKNPFVHVLELSNLCTPTVGFIKHCVGEMFWEINTSEFEEIANEVLIAYPIEKDHTTDSQRLQDFLNYIKNDKTLYAYRDFDPEDSKLGFKSKDMKEKYLFETGKVESID